LFVSPDETVYRLVKQTKRSGIVRFGFWIQHHAEFSWVSILREY